MTRTAKLMQKKNLRQLRTVAKRIDQTINKHYDMTLKLQTKIEHITNSIKRLQQIRGSAQYWAGMVKGKDCPAHQKNSYNGHRCLAWERDWLQPIRRFYPTRCFKCTISRKEALLKGTYNEVFRTKEHLY